MFDIPMELAPGRLITDQLRAQIDFILPPHKVWQRMLLFALLEGGFVEDLICDWDECLFDNCGFSPGTRGQRTISFDHRIPRIAGGSDEPSNIRLLHFYCNQTKGARDRWIYLRPKSSAALAIVNGNMQKRLSQSAAMSARWQDPEYCRKQEEGRSFEGWHRKYPGGCVECGRSDRSHKARGKCYYCYFQERLINV